jgi:hypothetical protein
MQLSQSQADAPTTMDHGLSRCVALMIELACYFCSHDNRLVREDSVAGNANHGSWRR